jgi:hypothetical protein
MLEPTDIERRDIVRVIFGHSLVDYATSSRFQAYFKHYCSVVCPASSGDAVVEIDIPALRSHHDVLNCVQIIFTNPRISFNDFIAKVLGPASTQSSMRERRHVARLPAEVAFAVNCTLNDHYPDAYADIHTPHAKWEGDMPFLSYLEGAIGFKTRQSRPTNQQLRITEMMRHRSSLKAWKLTKRIGIKIRRTDNLVEHLLLDRKTMTLKVFHQVSFLRAHLAKSKDDPLELGFEESLRK